MKPYPNTRRESMIAEDLKAVWEQVGTTFGLYPHYWLEVNTISSSKIQKRLREAFENVAADLEANSGPSRKGVDGSEFPLYIQMLWELASTPKTKSITTERHGTSMLSQWIFELP